MSDNYTCFPLGDDFVCRIGVPFYDMSHGTLSLTILDADKGGKIEIEGEEEIKELADQINAYLVKQRMEESIKDPEDEFEPPF